MCDETFNFDCFSFFIVCKLISLCFCLTKTNFGGGKKESRIAQEESDM